MDGTDYHVHPSVCKSLEHTKFSVGWPNGTLFAQGCDNAEISSALGSMWRIGFRTGFPHVLRVE